jgi:hypothetical protein
MTSAPKYLLPFKSAALSPQIRFQVNTKHKKEASQVTDKTRFVPIFSKNAARGYAIMHSNNRNLRQQFLNKISANCTFEYARCPH